MNRDANAKIDAAGEACFLTGELTLNVQYAPEASFVSWAFQTLNKIAKE